MYGFVAADRNGYETISLAMTAAETGHLKTGQISYETALGYSNDRTEMEKKLLSGI